MKAINEDELLDCPVECVQGHNTDLVVKRLVAAALQKELGELGNVLAQDGNFLDRAIC